MKGRVFRLLRRRAKYLFDRIGSESLKRTFLQGVPFWVASILTGLLAVGYAQLFSYAEKLSESIFHAYKWAFFIITPLCFVAAWWVVKKWASNARGSGIPQVMAALELSTPRHQHKIDSLLNLRIIVVKICSSLVMVLGGGAVGREGPTIQLAGSVFRIVNRGIPASWPRLSGQSFILTGAAAGLAAAFNTPLGGLVFAVEELARIHVRYFRTALFSAVIIAGLTAQGILGPYLYLGYPDVSHLKFSVFFAVMLVAIISGLAGSGMSRLILQLMQWRSGLRNKNVAYLVACGLVVAALANFVSYEIMGSGKELMTRLLFTENKDAEWHAVLMRVAGPVISFTTGAAGGVFAPSLAAGAGIGALVAGLMDFVGSNANILVLGGMVGFLTGVTRTPFTSAILVLEMTDRHSVIFHLLLAAMVANLAAIFIDKHSFYDRLKKQYLSEAHRAGDLPATPPA
ncbi:chloride channel protein [Paracnuella aquatica]|uniref:chloride channel protein n=1 Tax=Paracnuella aquatica TaxID=2268757 RepID=UPI000DEF5D8D|nr:chloride channel protein [Paracnuella aquatica]RPD48210.1 chloride channel protein [Paracnuella aquatica]